MIFNEKSLFFYRHFENIIQVFEREFKKYKHFRHVFTKSKTRQFACSK